MGLFVPRSDAKAAQADRREARAAERAAVHARLAGPSGPRLAGAAPAAASAGAGAGASRRSRRLEAAAGRLGEGSAGEGNAGEGEGSAGEGDGGAGGDGSGDGDDGDYDDAGNDDDDGGEDDEGEDGVLNLLRSQADRLGVPLDAFLMAIRAAGAFEGGGESGEEEAGVGEDVVSDE